MSTVLSISDMADKKKGQELTAAINQGLDRIQGALQITGPAVTELKEKKLWRFWASSWSEYCEQQKWTKRRFDQIVAAWKLVESLPDQMGTMVPTERAARMVQKVLPKKRGKVLKKILGEGKPVTAANIAAAAKDPPAKPPKQLDETGYPMPKNCVAIWERKQEIQDLLTAISELKGEIEKKKKDLDPLFAPVSNSIGTHFDQAYYCLSKAKPYAVCPSCEGHPEIQKDGCHRCMNTGLVCKSDYQTLTPQETIKIRERRVDMERARV